MKLLTESQFEIKILHCCGRRFSVNERDGIFMGLSLSDKAKFCPFCGVEKEEQKVPDNATPPVSKADNLVVEEFVQKYSGETA